MEAEARRRLRALRMEAAEYYRSHGVPQRMEDALNTLFPQRPGDLYGELANYLSKFSKAPLISKLVGRKVLDGVGQPTLEVETHCTVKNYERRICSVVMSSHFQTLVNALPETIEADEKERNNSVNTAVEWVNESLSTMLRDVKPTDQGEVDKMLGEFFTKKVEEKEEIQKREEREKDEETPSCIPPATELPGGKKAAKQGKKASIPEKMIPPAEPIELVLCGSLAIGGTSLAIAKAGATINHVPLYLHISLLKHNQVHVIFSLMTTCVYIKLLFLFYFQQQASKRISHLGCPVTGCDNLEQLLLLMQTACNNRSLELGKDMYLAINCAAHELMDYSKGKYEILTGTFKSPDEMINMYVELTDKFPFIIALIDPLRKEDRQQWTNICCALGSKCFLIAEDAATYISKRKIDQNFNVPTCSGVVLKYINQTKVSDLIELTGLLDSQRQITILGSPDGESSDDSLVDLAVGLGARFIKLGGLSRGERVTKYNRLLAIEEELAENRTLRMKQKFFFLLRKWFHRMHFSKNKTDNYRTINLNCLRRSNVFPIQMV
uniref:Enolase 4 n=1 Tax=Melopsittacus undulatus TaxID=13146 RepID=A0A8C6JA50_MELUD